MKLDIQKIFTGLLGKAYKLPDGEVSALLNAENATEESVIAALEVIDKARITAITKNTTGKFQEGYAKGKGEALTDLEKSIREKFEFEDSGETPLTGLELVEAIVTAKAPAEGGKKPRELTDDDVKKHTVYQDLERRFKTETKKIANDWQEKWNLRDTADKEKESFGSASSKIMTALKALNPVLPKGAKAAENQTTAFLKSFKEDFNFELQGDNILVLDKSGKPVMDGHGHSLDFDTLVKNRAAEHFDFAVQNGGANGGNGDQQRGDGAGTQGTKAWPQGIQKPKNIDEYLALVNDSKIPFKDRMSAKEAWESENPDKEE